MRGNVGGSRLIELLHAWTLADSEVSRQDWVEQLGQWLGPIDAITLQAALQSIQRVSVNLAGSATANAAAGLDAEFRGVHADLVKFIEVPLHEDQADAGYAPYRQRYLEIQRRMELRIDPFRTHCRQRLSQTTTPLRQLAELDAALESLLAAREKALLAKLPILLGARFGQVRKAHLEGRSCNFDRDFQDLAMAELSFRLEPVVGLMDALKNEA